MDAWGGAFGMPSAHGASFGIDPVSDLVSGGGGSGVPQRRRQIYPDKHEPRARTAIETVAPEAPAEEEETILHLLQ